jgi:tRNA (cmo5U34)-methyltransferase
VDAVPTRAFHAATSILVSHFLKTADEKLRLFEGIAHRLEPGGSLVTAELMTARDDDTSSLFLRAWKAYYLSNGIPPSEVDADFVRRKQAVAEISEDELHGILEQSGFKSIRRFYQAFHFAGYLCTKG